MNARGWVALAALSCSSACAPARGQLYDRAMMQASRAEGAGRLEEAAQLYAESARSAQRQRDRDLAQWDAADVLARAGHIAESVARFDAIARDATSEHQAEGAYRAATLRIEHGNAERGWRELEQLPRRFPSHGIAHVAVRRLIDHADDEGPDAALSELRGLERDLGATELGELVAFASANHLERLGDEEAARDAYLRIAARWPYPAGAFFDDALWRASVLDEKLGRYQAAIDDLERLVAKRQTTSLMGSYERAKYVPAALRIGELYRDRMHDRPKARAAFHRLYAEFAHSTKRDEALWFEAALWREDKREREACECLATLVREFPDSRYVPCAVEKCPSVERPRKSGAPKECHAYIERQEQRRDVE